MKFLTPELFDALVALVIVIGLIAAAVRIYRDFRSGPRWPDVSPDMPPDEAAEQPDSTDQTTQPDEEDTTNA